MSVEWIAKAADGTEYRGRVDDGYWRDLKQEIYNGANVKITSLSLHKEGVADARIDDNKDGYFLANKIIGAMGSDRQIHLVGLGYYSKAEPVVRVKWYNTVDMSLAMVEARPLEEAEAFLIKNI